MPINYICEEVPIVIMNKQPINKEELKYQAWVWLRNFKKKHGNDTDEELKEWLSK